MSTLIAKRALPPKRYNHVAPAGVNLITPALEYRRRGLAIIPVLGKVPALRVQWSEYTRSRIRPSEQDLHRWLDGGSVPGVVTGIACLLGDLSGGLCCLDHDQSDAYERWKAEHPGLASRLPTAKTFRGFHVYFRTSERVATKKLGSGEIRGEGAYTVLPPSWHPDGPTYQWIISLGAAGALDEVSLEAVMGRQPAPRNLTSSQAPKLPSERCCGITSLDEAVAAAIPTKPRTNDVCLFRLARALLALESDGKLGQEVEMQAFEAWHKETGRRGFLREDKCHYLDKFVRATLVASLPLGQSGAENAWEKSQSEPLPPEETARISAGCRSKLVHGLQSLCWQLSLGAGGGVWFLSCDKAGSLLACSGVTVWTWLNKLVQVGVLEVVEKAVKHERKATRYRYLPVATEKKGRIK